MPRHDKKPTGLYAFLTRHPRAVIVAAFILVILSLLYTKRNMAFLTGRDDLMPKNTGFHADYRVYRAEFADPEEIVVVMEGRDPQQVLMFGMELQRGLTGKKEIESIFFPASLPFFRQNGLLLLPLEDLRLIRRNLELLKPVLSDLAEAPSVETLFSSMTSRMERYMASPTDEELAGIMLMLGSLGKGLEQFQRGGEPASAAEIFAGEGAGFLSAGQRLVLTVLPVREAGSFVPAEQTIKLVRGELTKLLAKPQYEGVTAGLTGTPVLEYEEMATSRRDMNVALFLSLGLTVILLLLAFRGVLNVIAAMVSLLVAIALSFGLATAVVGHLNILSMVFAVMLVGLGIEYGIQLVLRYQEELAKGESHHDAVVTALRHNFRPIIMAALTTAAAFLTFVFTDFKGISELGIIAAMGVGLCVAATFTVLPALLIILAKYRKARPEAKGQGLKGKPLTSHLSLLTGFKPFLFGHPRAVMAGGLLLGLISIYFAGRVSFDYNLMNLQAKGIESVEYAYRLMTDGENSGYFAVATAPTAEEAEAKAKALEALPAVERVVTLATFAPADQQAKLAEAARIRAVLADMKPAASGGGLNILALPQVFEAFRNAVVKLQKRLQEADKPEAHEVGRFLAILDAFFAVLEKRRDTSARGMLEDFQGGMLEALPRQLALLRESLPSAPVTADQVPDEIKSRFVGRSGKYLLQIAPKERIFDREPLERFIGQIRQVDPHVTGEPVMVYESMTIMRSAYQWAFIYAFLAVVAILFITFRSLRYTLIGIAMLAAGVVFMVGGMGILGIHFNSANIIVMPLVLGVGIDSGIYIINRYRREGETPEQVILSSAGRGVILNTLTILASFGALMVAHHQGVFSIGAVMSLGMTACLFVFVLILPAVLAVFGEKRI